MCTTTERLGQIAPDTMPPEFRYWCLWHSRHMTYYFTHSCILLANFWQEQFFRDYLGCVVHDWILYYSSPLLKWGRLRKKNSGNTFQSYDGKSTALITASTEPALASTEPACWHLKMSERLNNRRVKRIKKLPAQAPSDLLFFLSLPWSLEL